MSPITEREHVVEASASFPPYNSASPRFVTVTVPVTLTALALPEEDGRYSIIVPALPGCVSMGNTIEEARANIAEAAEGWLAVVHAENAERAIRAATEPFESEQAQP